MSGRFVDRAKVGTVVLGACSCPGTPHDSDWAKVRLELSGSEWSVLAQGDTNRSLALLVVEWNFLDDQGEEVLVNEATVASLDLPTFKVIDAWVGEHLARPALPNASAARSRGSSRASGSPTPTAKMAPTSTTPSWQPGAASATTTSGTPLLSS